MDDAPEPPPEHPIDRIDRRLGMAWSRIGGSLFLAIGVAMLVSGLSGEGLPDRWPLLVGSLVLFGLARLAFTSRRGLADLLDDGPGRGK